MLKTLKAQIAKYREDRKPRLVGELSCKVTWSNAILGSGGSTLEYVYFYVTDLGKRSVKLTERGLRKQPVVMRYLELGILPTGARVKS